MKKMIEKTYRCIYGNDIIDKTTYDEYEFLYTTSILNLDIIFYAFKYVFKIIKKNNYHLYDNIDIINENIEEGNTEFNKKIKKLSKIEKRVIKTEDPILNFVFARDVMGADPIPHGKIVLEKGDAEINFRFATEVPGADINAHISKLEEMGQHKLASKVKQDLETFELK